MSRKELQEAYGIHGARIEVRGNGGLWSECLCPPIWWEDFEYRIKEGTWKGPGPVPVDDNSFSVSVSTQPGKSEAPSTTRFGAEFFLNEAQQAMKDRAASRDQEGGERSMASTVASFNSLRGKDLTESDGWAFMILLKLVRGNQGKFRADDYTDAAAYCGLLGECEAGK